MVEPGRFLGALEYLATRPCGPAADIAPSGFLGEENIGPIPFVMVASSGTPIEGVLFRTDGDAPLEVARSNHPFLLDFSGLENTENVPVHLHHVKSRVVGVARRLSIARGRLVATGVIDGDADASRFLIDGYDAGAPWRPSIGVGLSGVQVEFVGKGVVSVNARDWPAPLQIFRRWRLKEISLTTSPADEDVSFILGSVRDLLF